LSKMVFNVLIISCSSHLWCSQSRE
jgi:hypothetical protein